MRENFLKFPSKPKQATSLSSCFCEWNKIAKYKHETLLYECRCVEGNNKKWERSNKTKMLSQLSNTNTEYFLTESLNDDITSLCLNKLWALQCMTRIVVQLRLLMSLANVTADVAHRIWILSRITNFLIENPVFSTLLFDTSIGYSAILLSFLLECSYGDQHLKPIHR